MINDVCPTLSLSLFLSISLLSVPRFLRAVNSVGGLVIPQVVLYAKSHARNVPVAAVNLGNAMHYVTWSSHINDSSQQQHHGSLATIVRTTRVLLVCNPVVRMVSVYDKWQTMRQYAERVLANWTWRSRRLWNAAELSSCDHLSNESRSLSLSAATVAT